MIKFFEEIISYFIVFGVPIFSVGWLIVSIVKFVKRDRSDIAESRMKKKSLILSLVLSIVFFLSLAALITLLSISLSHM